jgi:hypothetical protein
MHRVESFKIVNIIPDISTIAFCVIVDFWIFRLIYAVSTRKILKLCY